MYSFWLCLPRLQDSKAQNVWLIGVLSLCGQLQAAYADVGVLGAVSGCNVVGVVVTGSAQAAVADWTW